MILAWLVGAIALIVLAGWVGLEWQYRQRAGNRLAFAAGQWNIERFDPRHYEIVGLPELINRTPASEVMVPELTAETTLLGKHSLEDVQVKVTITPQHPDAPARPDGYWFAYIVKLQKRTQFKVAVEITGPDLRSLKALWVRVHYLTYGQGAVCLKPVMSLCR